MRTVALTHIARWHILSCAVVCLLSISAFGYAQSIIELKSKAEDGDVQAQLALAKAYSPLSFVRPRPEPLSASRH